MTHSPSPYIPSVGVCVIFNIKLITDEGQDILLAHPVNGVGAGLLFGFCGVGEGVLLGVVSYYLLCVLYKSYKSKQTNYYPTPLSSLTRSSLGRRRFIWRMLPGPRPY